MTTLTSRKTCNCKGLTSKVTSMPSLFKLKYAAFRIISSPSVIMAASTPNLITFVHSRKEGNSSGERHPQQLLCYNFTTERIRTAHPPSRLHPRQLRQTSTPLATPLNEDEPSSSAAHRIPLPSLTQTTPS